MTSDGFNEQCLNCINCINFIRRSLKSGGVFKLPVLMCLNSTIGCDNSEMRRRQLLDPLIYSSRGRHVLVTEKQIQSLVIDRLIDTVETK